MKFNHRMAETFARTKTELHLKAKDILTRLAFFKIAKVQRAYTNSHADACAQGLRSSEGISTWRRRRYANSCWHA